MNGPLAADTGATVGTGTVLEWLGRSARRVGVAGLGGGLVLVGLALVVLPGPGSLLVIAGLAVLATEFAWAGAALVVARRKAGDAGKAVRRRARRR